MSNDVFAVVADPTRRRILEAVVSGPRPVNDVVADLGVSQPTVSKHLKVLREAGLVSMTAQGQRRLYVANPEPLSILSDWAEGLVASRAAARSSAEEASGAPVARASEPSVGTPSVEEAAGPEADTPAADEERPSEEGAAPAEESVLARERDVEFAPLDLTPEGNSATPEGDSAAAAAVEDAPVEDVVVEETESEGDEISAPEARASETQAPETPAGDTQDAVPEETASEDLASEGPAPEEEIAIEDVEEEPRSDAAPDRLDPLAARGPQDPGSAQREPEGRSNGFLASLFGRRRGR